jgi:asparagine synthase (glutamine-hydrolysing)
MFQSAGINMVKLQAKAMNIPLIIQKTKGEKELELLDLKKAIQKAKDQYKIDAIVTGALFSTYQRDRIEKIAEDLGLKVFSPLWHKSQEQHMLEAINNNIKFIITAIAADGLDKSWLKKEITLKELEQLKKLHKTNKLNIAGEGGEFESLVLDCPLFEKKIQIEESKKVMDSICSGYLEITKAKLIKK